MEREELTPLTEVPEGEVAELRRVSDRNAEMLRYLASLGLKPGVKVEVGARQPFRGPLTLRLLSLNPREVIVGWELASMLYCEVRPKEAG
jgi:DtxR family Mn-dependent transcriptional regulator